MVFPAASKDKMDLSKRFGIFSQLHLPRRIVIMLLSLSVHSCWSTTEHAVLRAESPNVTQEFCMIYYPEFKRLPASPKHGLTLNLLNATRYEGCSELPTKFDREAALTRSTNVCPVERTIVNFKKANAAALIMASNKFERIQLDSNDTRELDIVVGYVSERTATLLLKMMAMSSGESEIKVSMFSITEAPFDLSLLVIWLIAVFTVAVGAFWSGRVRLELFLLEQQQRGLGPVDCRRYLNGSAQGGGNGFGQEHKISHSESLQGYSMDQGPLTQEESSLDVSPLLVTLFVVCMGGMLILLYFFFQYLVYFIIGMFAIASVTSLIGVLEPLVNRIPLGTTRIPRRLLPCFYGSLQIRHVVLILFSIGLTSTWLALRHKPWSWALQDFLGVAFSLNMLRTLRLPNLLISSVLLVLLFFYDIFFVFVTPFLTMKGESVMVEVARGAADTQEQLPMVLRVPHLGSIPALLTGAASGDPLSVCFSQFSLLGFGDILVPGLLVSYCHAFDLLRQTKPARLYYTVSVVFYGVGLLVTFVALWLMKTAQPALLYLVPCTLLPVVLVALCRGELRVMWRGHFGPLMALSSPERHGSAASVSMNRSGGNVGVTEGTPPDASAILTDHTAANQQATATSHLTLPPYGATEAESAPIYQTDATLLQN